MGQIGKWYPDPEGHNNLILNTGQMEALVPELVTGEVIVVQGDATQRDAVEVPQIVEQTPSNVHVHEDPDTGEQTVLVVSSMSDEVVSLGLHPTDMPAFFSQTGPEQTVSARVRRRVVRSRDDEALASLSQDADDQVGLVSETDILPTEADESYVPGGNDTSARRRFGERLSQFLGDFRDSLVPREPEDTEPIDPLLLQKDEGEVVAVRSSESEGLFLPPDILPQDAVVLRESPLRMHRLEDVRMAQNDDDVFSVAPLPSQRHNVGGDLLLFDIASQTAQTRQRVDQLELYMGSLTRPQPRRWPYFVGGAAAVAAGMVVASVGNFTFTNHGEDAVTPVRGTENTQPSTTYEAPDFSTLPQDTVVETTVGTSLPASSVVPLPETATTQFSGEPVSSRDITDSVFAASPVFVPRASIPELTTTTSTTKPEPTTTESKVFYDNVYIGQQKIKIETGGYLSHLQNQYNKLCGTNLSLDSFTALLQEYNDPGVISTWVSGTLIQMPPAENWCR